MINLIGLVPLLPLLGFLLILSFKEIISKKLAGLIGVGSVLGAFLIVLGIFSEFLSSGQSVIVVPYYTFAHILDFHLELAFQIDPLSLLMMCIVTGVGFFIHIYSMGYMHDDPDYARYFAYLNLFMFSMLLLVTSANYFFLFIGWEGVGVSSLLLIAFWFKNVEFGKAGMKAFIMNRTGDLGFLAGMMLIYTTFGTFNFTDIFEQAKNLEVGDTMIVAITLLLFIGATAKSAQIPLYTWLPDAMAGPTPVSALMHAATMVTAGIYMISRSSILYVLAPFTLEIIMIIGVSTAMLAALIALTQNDIKKVLAYSTVSQLGYMFLALGVGAFSSAMFHLMTHAFFKALLFLCAGSVIHAMGGIQDVRYMGGLKKYMPVTFMTFLLGTLAISGLPPFAGFFSKDEILAYTFAHNPMVWGIALLGALITAFYMFRLLYLTFYQTFRGTHEQEHHLHESPKLMTIPLMVLGGLSVVGGLIGIPELLGGANHFKDFLSPVFADSAAIAGVHAHLSHSTEFILMGVSITLIIASILYARHKFITKKSVPALDETTYSSLHRWSYDKFYVDEFYRYILLRPFHWMHDQLSTVVETNIIDKAVNGVGNLVTSFSSALRLLQNGRIGVYIFIMVIGVLAILLLHLMS